MTERKFGLYTAHIRGEVDRWIAEQRAVPVFATDWGDINIMELVQDLKQSGNEQAAFAVVRLYKYSEFDGRRAEKMFHLRSKYRSLKKKMKLIKEML